MQPTTTGRAGAVAAWARRYRKNTEPIQVRSFEC
jgi:hypothetical protein